MTSSFRMFCRAGGRVLMSAIFLAALAPLAHAQVDRATLSGLVRDASEAVVPGASVTLTHLLTGVATSTAVTAEGTYVVVNLAPGEYLVEVQAPGFQRLAQTVLLEVGSRARLDLSLTVGALSETIRVEGVTPLLNAETAALGTVVDQNEISKLPLAIRNWDDLLALVAGVQSDRYTEQAGGTSSGRTGGVSVHGNRTLHNNFLLDGVANNSFSTNVQELSTQISRPSVDAIDEFKVVTSPYAAEYGWAPGAAIVVNTKSGTNALRGTAYDYARNDRFDSNNFFATRANQAKPTNEQNQFGFNLGGPLLRNRAFFFGDFEGTRINQGVLRTGRVATAEERRGVFAGTIRDPLTGQPFPNNTIPQDRIDPVAAAILGLVPMPNTSGNNNFIRQPEVEDTAERYLGRLDVRASATDNLFVRYIYSDRFRYVPGWFGGVIDGTSTSAWGRNDLKSHALVGGWNKVLGSSFVNEARVSYARGINDGVQDPFGQNGMEQIGFRGVPQDDRILGGIVGIDLGSAHIRMGSPNFMPKFQHTEQLQWLNTTTWIAGRHMWKFGADVMAPMRNEYMDVPSTRGNLAFNGQFTGNQLADFLLGYASGAELSNVYVVNQRLYSTSFFVQDDWKATDALTLNLGLRYDFMTPPYEADNRMANFDPVAGALVTASDGSLRDRALIEPDTNNLAPRVGAVYKMDEATVIRAGYGIFYNQFDRIGSEDQLALNPPGLRNINFTAASGSTTPALRMRDGFPPNFLDASNIVLSRLLIRAADANAPRAMVHQFGAGFERQFGRAFVASIDVVGSMSRHLAVLRNINQPLPGTLDANGPLPYPSFGHVQWREHTGEARYRGMDLAFERRFRDGYSYRLAYTLGDSRDQAPEHLAAASGRPQNGRDLSSWEGPSDFDIRHRFVGNFVAELPFGDGKPYATSGVGRAILGGWLVSGIYSARTGRPFTVTQSTNNVGAGTTGLPNLTGDPEGDKTVDRWFNAAAFTAVPSGVFGNAGRNILRGPGWMTFDMSVQRRLAIGQRLGATLRWDVFNLFDRANLGLPAANISSASTVGVISSLAGDPRTMQFALRVDW
jgi:outer membrane receptor protein involved in Fe transport